jgi:hypothetical protein
VVLAVVFMASGGKPYYLAGVLPALLGAGAVSVDRWLERGASTLRRALLGCALALSALIGATIALPVLPEGDAGPVVEVNEDVGETIGWPELASTVVGVYRQHPRSTVILTRNYGEAGAIDRYGPELGLPPAYSGHNACGDWGPPPDDDAPVIAVGLPPEDLAELGGCALAARIDNDADIDNEEQGTSVRVCSGPPGGWPRAWDALRHLG